MLLSCIILPGHAFSQQAAGEGPVPAAGGDLALLVSWMSGSFSSEAQSKGDGDFFDIRLEMAPIWTDRTDGFWLYVEQAAADHRDKPYRQRVYHLTLQEDGTIRSDIYALPGEPLDYAGAWKDPAVLDDLQPGALVLRTGCAVMLRKTAGDRFEGGTAGHDCASSLRGARYATSEVVVTPHQMVSWDRGYDKAGEQIWGAVKGGYIFIKVEN
jgi:hypothetical protein